MSNKSSLLQQCSTGALTLLLAFLLATATTATAVQLTPTLPVLDVPFLAVPGLSSGATLFVSKYASCNSTVVTCTMGGSASTNYDSNTCVFTVTSTSIGLNAVNARAEDVPPLYWCSSASSSYIDTLTLSKITPTPPYAFLGVAQTMTFNNATPITSQFGFYSTPCENQIAGTEVLAIDSSRTLSFKITSGTFAVLCGKIPSVSGVTKLITVAGINIAASPFTASPTQGLRYTSVTFTSNTYFTYMSLSVSPNCVPLAQTPTTVTSTGDAVTSLTISAPRGTYYVCGKNLIASVWGTYIPSENTFDVKEYGIQPHTLYLNLATTMTMTLDANVTGSTFEAALFSDTSCTTSVMDWSTSPVWTVPLTGTYYACIRQSGNPSSMARSAAIRVVQQPSVTFSRSPAVRGLALGVTVSRPLITGVITVGLSTASDCGNIIATGATNMSGSNADLQVPTTASATMYYCVSTPNLSNWTANEESAAPEAELDNGHFYPFGTITTRAYNLGYPALRTNTSLTITLDSTITFSPGTRMRLLPAASSCSGALASNNNNDFSLTTSTTSLSPVSFPSGGSWLLCVSEPTLLGGKYIDLRTLTVYANATVSPVGLITGLSAVLSISDIPASTAYYFLSGSTTCSGSGSDSNKLYAATSTASGTGKATVSLASDGVLTLCVGYYGEQDSVPTSTTIYAAGEVRSTTPSLYPSVAVAGQTTIISVVVQDKLLLQGGLAYLTSTGSTCTTPAPTSATQLALATDGSAPTFSYSPTTAEEGSSYHVCVGSSSSGFVSAGELSIVGNMVLSISGDGYAASLMPVTVTFSGDAFTKIAPRAFIVVQYSDQCSSAGLTALASGTITSAGVSSTFLAPAATTTTPYRLCVASSATSATYSYGGDFLVYPFTSLSAFAQRSTTNSLQGWPVASGASFFLTPCAGASCDPSAATATCAAAPSAAQFTTSSTVALSGAPIGTYLLCQRSTSPSSVVGSNTTLSVVDAWTLSWSPGVTVKQYVALTVTLGGGNTGTTSGASSATYHHTRVAAALDTASTTTYSVRVQPSNYSCSVKPSESQTFSLAAGTSNITITDVLPRKNIVFCLIPSTYDSFNVGTTTLNFYMSPSTLVADVATAITSSTTAVGTLSKISSLPDCSNIISTGEPQSVMNAVSTLTVVGCDMNSAVYFPYYCESTDGGSTYTSRGQMVLLRRTSCPNGATASILPATTPPGQTITALGLDTTVLANPSLSSTSDCSILMLSTAISTGYIPRFDESATLYVCATSVHDSTYYFTTTSPSLTVLNYNVTPTAALSRLNVSIGVLQSTSMTLNYKTPTTLTFFSAASDCSMPITSASGMSASAKTASYSSTAVNSLAYVCTPSTSASGATVAIAAFLSVSSPSISRMSPAIITGATFVATLQVEGYSGQTALYSMHPGTDSSYAYASYYVNSSRAVYLSADSCKSVLSGTSETTVNASGKVGIAGASSTSSSVLLCTTTPAGVAQAASIPVTSGVLYPTQFVTGSTSQIYIPLQPNTVFSLSKSSGTCDAVVSALPTFTTDGDGFASLVLVKTDNTVADVGTYTVCYTASGSSTQTALSTITVVAATYYSVRGYNYLVGVPGVMYLEDDLTSSNLLSGFSKTTDCASPNTTYGSWTEASSTSIVINATRATSSLYLCASVAANNTVTALPVGGSTLVFSRSTVGLPAYGSYTTCAAASITGCSAPGYTLTTGGMIGIVAGNCCDTAGWSSRVVASTSTNGGTCNLLASSTAVRQYADGTVFSICAWSTADSKYCATLGSTTVLTNCTSGGGSAAHGAGGGLSHGAKVAIIVVCVVCGVIIIAVVIFLLYWFCCRKKPEAIADQKLVALRHMETSRLPSQATIGGSQRHPLMYYGANGYVGSGSGSDSTPSPSRSMGATQYNTVVEGMEDDARDQLMLEEARQRYQLRLLFNEQLELIKLTEKENDVNADVTFNDDEDLPVGNAVPELRPLEIDVEPSTATADPNTSTASDVQRLKAQPITSARPFGQAAADSESERESCFTDQDEDDQLHDDTDLLAPTAEEMHPLTPMQKRNADVYRRAIPVPPAVTAVPDASSIMDESPIRHDGSGDRPSVVDAREAPSGLPLFSTASAVGRDGSVRSDDTNELSFTTTQRFHDEKQYLLAQEETRRGRLRNWEGEERAALAAEALQQKPPTPAAPRGAFVPLPVPQDESVPEDALRQSNASSTGNYSYGAPGMSRNEGASTGSQETAPGRGDSTRELVEDEEELAAYTAPRRPARLPGLPPVPRVNSSNTNPNSNDSHYIVGGVDASDEMMARIMGVQFSHGSD